MLVEGIDSMVEEKFYELDDNTKMVLIENVLFDGKRFLLLNKDNTDEVSIGYEEDGKLFFIDDNYPKYSEIALSLLTKLERGNK